MKRSCTICGCSYGGIYAFKAGHICENCVKLLKATSQVDTEVRAGDHF